MRKMNRFTQALIASGFMAAILSCTNTLSPRPDHESTTYNQSTFDKTTSIQRSLREMKDFQNLLISAVYSLEDIQENLYVSREIAKKAAHSDLSAKTLSQMASAITANQSESLNILNHSFFEGKCIFHSPEYQSPTRYYPVALSSSEARETFRLSSSSILESITKIYFPETITRESFQKIIPAINQSIGAVSQEKSQATSYLDRIGFAIAYENIYLDSRNTNTNALASSIRAHNRKIQDWITALALMSATDNCTEEERRQFNMEFQELLKEMIRIEAESGINCDTYRYQNADLSTQEAAEKLLQKLPKTLCRK